MDAVFKAVFGNEMPAVIFIINAFGIYFKLFLLPRSLYRSKKSDRCESHRRHFAGSSRGIPGRLNLFLQINKTGCCEHYAPAARRFAFRAAVEDRQIIKLRCILNVYLRMVFLRIVADKIPS